MDKQVIASDADGHEAADRVVVEEPLQITVDGRPVAVTMRTPGQDEELALGFLRTEGVIAAADQVRKIDLESKPNHALVFLADGVAVDFSRLTRHVFGASSCGLCGKATIDAVQERMPPLKERASFRRDVLLRAPAGLAGAQSVFARTGGLHAAGIFGPDGTMHVVREDIGRHNAVDKVLGAAVIEARDPTDLILLVTGRISGELAFKAARAQLAAVATPSVPSTIAVDIARAAGMLLIGRAVSGQPQLHHP